jgi:zinc transporter ZupT
MNINKSFWRMGLFTALSIGIHNFSGGLVTGMVVMAISLLLFI